jgi:hypothetical protein
VVHCGAANPVPENPKNVFLYRKGPRLTYTLLLMENETGSVLYMFPLPVIEGRQEGGLQLAPELVENEGQDEQSPGIGEIVQKSEHVNIK